MNDRMSDNEALVELAAQAHYESLEWGGCAGGGWIRQPEGPRKDRMDAMRAALLAFGLPALLERVEAAEGDATWLKSQWGDACAEERRLTAERDALAAKVADAWDEGWLASKRHERSEGQPKMSYWPNPYRTALDASETP